jgi:sacsin
VALSPHCSLITRPGNNGLRFNFVSKTPYPKDQLAAFSAFVDSFDGPFEGTIIRIPLRTKEQAEKSEIIDLAITPEDILKEFKAFRNEAADSLLFLKSIEKVEFHFDDQFMGGAEITNIEDCSLARSSVKSSIMVEAEKSITFQLKISQWFDNDEENEVQSIIRRYHVQHKFTYLSSSTISSDLKKWAAKEKLYPWVALAAPIDPPPSSIVQSRLFVSLPLPIFMKDNRVNIHGIFALSRDRRSLWTMMDAQSSGRVTNEIIWNTYLFKYVIPAAWQEMLVELAKLGQPIYDYFPIITPRPSALDDTLAMDVLQTTIRNKSPVWLSIMNTMLPLEAGFLPHEEPSEKLLDALKLFSMPVFHGVPRRLISQIRTGSQTYTPLTPSAVRKWLRGKFESQHGTDLNIPTAIELLRFVLSDKIYTELHGLPLFPCKNGQIRSLTSRNTSSFVKFKDSIYVATDEEFKLFGAAGELFLDLSTCDKDVADQIKKDMVAISAAVNLRRFNLDSFRLYAQDQRLLKNHSTDGGFMMDNSLDLDWINGVWRWLESRKGNDQVVSAVDAMYLIPLEGQMLHKV